MSPNENRRPGRTPRIAGKNCDSTNTANVIRLSLTGKSIDPFEGLTHSLALHQCRAGTLPEGVLVALLAGVGVRP